MISVSSQAFICKPCIPTTKLTHRPLPTDLPRPCRSLPKKKESKKQLSSLCRCKIWLREQRRQPLPVNRRADPGSGSMCTATPVANKIEK